MRIRSLLIFSLFCLFIAACNKDEDITFDPNAKLSFSTDSVLFDTVFTSVGSTHRRFKIFNPNAKAINIDQILLSGGANSPFSINVVGQNGLDFKNIKIKGNDSLNVLIKVTINPNTATSPFITEDSILFFFNGRKEKIPLVAYGQNAIFLKNVNINENTTWDSKLPYIIYSSVTVAENAELKINPGSRILFHNGATMNIKGSLIAQGTVKDSILFAGDRLERIYEEEPGQWNGLHFYPSSRNSIINNATIKNAAAGITVDSISNNNNPKLILANTSVKNMQVVGFLGYHASFTAFNNLFYNCGQYLMYGVGGGAYNLKQNTFAAYNFNFARRTSALYFSDTISDKEFAPINLNLTNNIIWGSLDNELFIETVNSNNSTININGNLIKTLKNNYNNNNIINQDPLFINPRIGNFEVRAESPVLAKGINLFNDPYFVPFLKHDKKNKERLFPSDLGCYQKN
ncbi:hypothetical protein [Pedobacter montanisoli]|uniref:Right handed beta helix domain-containing protein n=1 Tax=Pedobacter montanisoli TaxID=2923277 RepID=A0ABS9ZSK6_9SPHI|nr:hypothetical protein [Pedobacter montanisoli]MCJ0741483.1 hypothetical protein [Pedobacter montanisoli]